VTRIGRCQIKTQHLVGNASYRRDNLAPLKVSRSNCVDQYHCANATAILNEARVTSPTGGGCIHSETSNRRNNPFHAAFARVELVAKLRYAPCFGLPSGARRRPCETPRLTIHPSRLSDACDVFGCCDCCGSCDSCDSWDCFDGFSAPYRSLIARPPIQSDLSPAG
jgi:hypothetical protein